jgi:hypothetical protein
MEKLTRNEAPEAESYPSRDAAVKEALDGDNKKLKLYFEGVQWEELTPVFTNKVFADNNQLLEGEVHVQPIPDGEDSISLPVLITEAEVEKDEAGNIQ